MIFELITINKHKNNLASYKCIDGENIFFRKKSMLKESNKIIENENNGYVWFFTIKGKDNKAILKKGNLFELNIPYFKGKTFNVYNKLSGNENYIFKIIKLYRQYWLNSNNFAIHGDFGLANIILKDNDIEIIDWEHFHFNDIKYFGFDIFNLLFISLFYEFRGNGLKIGLWKLKKDFLITCYKLLFEGINDDNVIKNSPFINTKKYLLDNESKFNLNIPIQNKFVIAGYSEEILSKLDLIYE